MSVEVIEGFSLKQGNDLIIEKLKEMNYLGCSIITDWRGAGDVVKSVRWF